MKQYLHTIMRSLCIMVMLCGISTGAWAQEDWGEVFQLENPSDDENPAENNSDNRYLITDWSTFIDNIINKGLSADGYYFRLDNNSITSPIVITEAPENSFGISYDYLDLNGCTFTIGEDGNPIPFPSSFVPLFSDSNLENSSNVTYYFSVTTAEQLSAIASDYSNITTNSNVYFSLGDNITLESVLSDCPYDIDGTYFNFGDNNLIVGSIDNPATFDSNYTSVFSTDLDSSVEYYYKAENDTWNGFVNYYNGLSEKGNVYLVMTGNFELTSTPDYALDIDGDHFIDNGYKISISDSFDVFADSGMNESYVDNGDWTVTQDNWSDFKSALNNNEIKDNAPITFSGEIVISDSDMPENSISHNNITFEDNCTITVGSDGSPISTFPSTFISLFNSDDAEKYVKYYYEITEDNWDDAVSFYNGLSNTNVYLVANSSIELDDFPENTLGISEDNFICSSAISVGTYSDPVDFESSFNTLFSNETLEAKVSYYIEADYSNWNDFVSYYNALDEGNKSRVNLVITGDVQLTDFPSETLQIADGNYYYGSNSISVGDSSNPVDMSDYKPVFSDNTLNSGVKYNLEIDSQNGMNYYLENASALSSECTIYLDNNGDAVDCWYDYDMSSMNFSGSSSTIIVNTGVVSILLSDKSAGYEPFTASTEDSSYGSITYFYTPSYELVDILFNNAFSEPDNRGTFFTEHENEDGHSIDVLFDKVGHGTQSYPYQIYTYEMLGKLVEIVNTKDNGYTSGMYINLMADINAQGNDRLTGIDGSITLDEYNTGTVQFSKPFKGHINGCNYSIGGLTQPLFSSLDGAEITNLGIVDCNMGSTTPALATSANNSKVSMSYVSGVSAGLIPASGITATNCYAFNPQTYANRTNKTEKLATTETDGYKAYNISKGTGDGKVTLVDDLSGTHKVIKGNSYAIAGGYSDCTLFIPTSNTFYTYSPSTPDMSTYISYINWADNFDWIESPFKSNVALLHNVLYNDFWNKNINCSSFEGYGGKENLPHLYSWYIVDKANFTVPTDPFRVKNIYYSRNNTSTSSPAPDGLNTIYLPFAWNPATDLYYKDANGVEHPITDAEVYILADKLNSSDQFSDDDGVLYKDYSVEKSLLFFNPVDDQAADNRERYNDFANISNALPTILNIPKGESGWYIKRTDLANYGIEIADNQVENINNETVTIPNLYDRYWADASKNSDEIDRFGRSFMEIDRLGGSEWSESSNQSEYTYSYYHSIDEVSGCDKQEPVTVMNRDEKEVYDNGNSITVTIYKAPESNAIAVDGGNYQIKIKSYDEENNETILYETDGDDRIVIDSDGKPAILYAYDENEKVVINNDGTINVYTSDGNGGYTSSGDPISIDFEYDSRYDQLSSGFYVCGGHEDGVWADQSGVYDFPGRAYHLGTFSGLAAGTFDDGKIASNSYYSSYKLNSEGTGFVKVKSTSTVQPFRTFFAIAKGVGDIDTGTPSEAKAYRFGFCGIFNDNDIDDTPTEIDGAPIEGIRLMKANESRVYSLDGRYVGQYGQKKLAHGMYIMNGKKFVVK